MSRPREGGWVLPVSLCLALVLGLLPLPAVLQPLRPFWLALVLISFFAVWLQWLPATGYTRFADSPWEWFLGLVLPVLSVSMYSITSVAKQTRDAMADVMGRDFIRALRACGLPERSVIWKHALRNAALPVVTVLGLVMIGAILLIQILVGERKLGRRQSGDDALLDQRPLILGKRAEQIEQELAVRGGGVDRLGQ